MPTPKKLNLLDKLYKVYKETNGPAASQTDRINYMYRNGGYKDKVDKYLSNHSVNGAKRAKKEIARFHEDLFPHEMNVYFEENPRLDRQRDFERVFGDVESSVGPIKQSKHDQLAEEWKSKFGPSDKEKAESIVDTYMYLISQTAKQNNIPVDEAAEAVYNSISSGKSTDDADKIKKIIELVKNQL